MERDLSPLISVVIPTRQRPFLLMNRSLPSVLAQSYSNLEVVVVVDGPDPETVSVLTELASRDSRVRPVFLSHNMGGSDARNAGVQAARGEWIAFLDDDDEMLPHRVEQQLVVVMHAKHGGVRWPVSICGWLTRMPESDTPSPPRLPDADEEVGDYIMVRRGLNDQGCGFSTSTIFAPRELVSDHLFQSGLPRQQDCDWVLRVNALPEVHFLFSQQVATIWYFGEARKQISNTLHWPQSLAWILDMYRQNLVSGRAVAGFINFFVADYAKRHGQYRALSPLTRAMLLAKPGLMEWLRFIFIWGVPTRLRQLLRHVRSRPAQPALIPEVPPISQSATAYLPLPTHSSSVEKTG